MMERTEERQDTQPLGKDKGPMLGIIIMRASRILRELAQPLTARQLAQVTAIPIAAVYRMVNALVRIGWLKRVGHAKGLGWLFVRNEEQQVFKFPLYPRTCTCGVIMRTPEHEKQHMSATKRQHLVLQQENSWQT